MLKLGLTVEGLLGELDQKYPQDNPHPDHPITHIMFRAGQRDIIEWIRRRLQEDD